LGRILRKNSSFPELRQLSHQLVYRLNLSFKDGAFIGMSICDNLLVAKFKDTYPWLQHLPDYEPTELILNCEFCNDLNLSQKALVGVVGSLRGYRGSESLVKYWQKYKNFQIVLVGEYFPSTHSKKTRNAIKKLSKTRYNFTYLKKVQTDTQLNHFISHVDAIYLDSIQYPEPSGIASRALQMGKTIIIESGDSYLNDLLYEEPKIQLSHIFSLSENKFYEKINSLKSVPPKFVAPKLYDVTSSYKKLWQF
jgi:hypothetical protein